MKRSLITSELTNYKTTLEIKKEMRNSLKILDDSDAVLIRASERLYPSNLYQERIYKKSEFILQRDLCSRI